MADTITHSGANLGEVVESLGRYGAIAALESERRNGCVGNVVRSSIAIAFYQEVWADSCREILGMRIASDRRD